MYEQFQVQLPSGEIIKGCHWKAKNPTHNLVLHTGMNEYAARYEPLAEYLNEFGINVWVHDAFGQGLNAKSLEELEIWPEDGFFKSVDGLALNVERVKKETGLPTVLMGFSMGSFMAQSYLERHPNTADKVIIAGSDGPSKKYGLAKFIAELRVNKKNWTKKDKLLSYLCIGNFSSAVKDRKTDVDWLSHDPKVVQAYIDDPYCGADNTKSFFLGFFTGLASLYKKKNLANISKDEKILVIAGDEDPVGGNGKGPRKLAKMYQKLGVKDVTLIIYPGQRHEIHNGIGKHKTREDLKDFILR